MTLKPLVLDNGEMEYQTEIESTELGTAHAQHSWTHSPPHESISQLVLRVYGADTKALRDRVRHANLSLDGLVKVPLS
jgi:hypothetical protein